MKSLVIGMLIFAISASAASAYCSAPSAPFCATRYGQFDDQYEFDSCKREMESYQSDVENFLRCQNLEVDRMRSENQRAINDYNDAVQSFNRRARG